jgi:hypothetical protein
MSVNNITRQFQRSVRDFIRVQETDYADARENSFAKVVLSAPLQPATR